MRPLIAFLRLSRPTFLLGGFAGFALGAAIAAYEGARITPAIYAAGQAMVTAFHLMTHYANEYFDRHTDRLGDRTPFSGGSGVLVAGALPPSVALVAALVCASIGALLVAAFARAGIPVAAAIGAAIGAFAWIYSAPPARLSGRGWGELNSTLVVAILVPLAGYAAFTGRVDGLAVAATLAPACAMFAMMIAVEWPDREADAAGGKHNLVVRFGTRTAARLASAGALLVVPVAFVPIACGAPWIGPVFGLLLLPLILRFVQRLGPAEVPAAEIAARGVLVFFLTVLFQVLGYVTILYERAGIGEATTVLPPSSLRAAPTRVKIAQHRSVAKTDGHRPGCGPKFLS